MARLSYASLWAALLLSGCELLPIKENNCTDGSGCPTYVKTPFVLGQPDEKTNWLLTGVGHPSGVLIMGSKLVVSDQGSNRILIWNSFPTKFNQAPDMWLGEVDLSVANSQGPSEQFVNSPTRLATDGTNLVVASDQGYSSSAKPLVFWNPFPTANYAPFQYQINPGSFAMAAGNNFNGGSPLFVSGHLYLADRLFHRLLYWASPPSQLTPADVVLGQATATASMANGGGAVGNNTFNGPEGTPASNGTILYVADTLNNRVLGYNALPTMATATADFALGQGSLTSNGANVGGATLSTMNAPTGISLAGTKLAVVDRNNHRVLLWNSLPTANAKAADVVLGQPNGSATGSNYGGISASGLNNPVAVSTDGTRIAVADYNNNRVLIWNSWPTNPGAPADLVLGQPSMTGKGYNGELASPQRLGAPISITHADSRFIVADADLHRVLIYPQFPTNANAQPTMVLGQPDMTSGSNNNGGTSASSLAYPCSVSTDGWILGVADAWNSRVLLWRGIPSQTRQPADVVLGQATMAGNDSNSGTSLKGLNYPCGVFVGGGRVYVADSGNHRVLIWKSIPTQNQQPPDIVLGQSDMTANHENHDAPKIDATTLSGPAGVFADYARIFVSDTGNDRVLVWNTLDPVNGQPADLVIGASDFGSDGKLGGPAGLQVYHSHLYVAQQYYNRIAVWNSLPTQNGVPADSYIGQPSLQSTAPNAGGLGINVLQRPTGFLVSDLGIYIADIGNGRVVARPPQP